MTLRCTLIAASAAVVLLTSNLAAEPYPSGPVRIVLPFAPGGQLDVIGRPLAEYLGRTLRQPFLLEHRPGAASTVGAEAVARAPADGSTLLYGTTSTYAIAPTLYKRSGYDPRTSFAPIAIVSEAPMVLVAVRTRGFNTVGDLLAAARKNPGSLSFASAGAGTPPHLLGELFKQAAAVDLLHVPYKGGAPAMADLVAGHVDAMFEVATTVLPQVQSGSVVALMTLSASRSPQLPDVPTAAEAGFPGLALASWNGLAAPVGTPRDVVDTLNRAVNDALATAAMQQLLATAGIRAVGGSAAAMSARIERELPIWQAVIEAAKVRMD